MSAPTPAPGDDRPREGYYPDPSIPGYVRYWNGAAWVPGTSRPAPADGEPLGPPPGAGSAAALVVEETGPHFFDEDPVAAPRGGGPEPASSWGADRNRQSGFGEQDHRVSWGAPAPADPRLAHTADPTAHPADTGHPDGTFVFRRPATGDAAGTPGDASPGVPGPGAPVDEGTVTFRTVPPRNPAAGAPGVPGQGAPGSGIPSGGAGPAGTPAASGAGGPGFGAGKAAAARAAAAQAPGQAGPRPDTASARTPGQFELPPGTASAQGAGEAGFWPGAASGQGREQAGSQPGAGSAQAPGQVGPLPGTASAQGAGQVGSWPGAASGQGREQAGSQPGAGSAQAPGRVGPPPGGAAAQGAGEAGSWPGAASGQAPGQAGSRPGAAAAQGPGARPGGASASASVASAGAASGPPGAPGPGVSPMSSGAGGGQSSWAQQVHRLAGSGEQQPDAPWKPPVEDPFQAAARRQAAARPAGLGKRLAARLVDSVVLGGVTAVAAVPLGTKAIDHVNGKIDEAKLSGRTVTVWLLDGTTGTYLAVVLAVLLLVGVVYEVLPTAKWGRTLGKKLCGLEVRDIEGHEPPSFGPALRRWLVWGVPGLLGIGLVGMAWCLFDRPWRQCWHDKAAHTFVAG
ncbi:RDD family protein [Streptomyces sp. NPDC017179]|uniref:RDD family protein n=1 Tax=Streptomyces sp. NPDC017179 TaxID=3364979 RepID=UPI00378C3D5D